MNRFRNLYIKISAILYGIVLLIGCLVWLSARYLLGVVPMVITAPAGVRTIGLLILGAAAGIALIQLSAWVISHILYRVTSVRG